MKNIRKQTRIFSIALAMAIIPLTAQAHCGACGAGGDKEHKHAQKSDIVDTAVAAGSFNTLAAALTAAGLVDTLKGDGPFTVFAPTDEAFAKLPAETLESLLKPENKQQLTDILTYHVVAGKVKAKKVVKMDSIETIEGSDIAIRVEDGTVYVDNAKVVKTDVYASNGVIHVIDTVLIPID
jgi:uncharacterized surface protein with fasciclin (FAS1) repeats